MTPDERTALSYWFPVVERLLPPKMYPATEIVALPEGCKLVHWLDGVDPVGFDEFESDLIEAVERMGIPCFMRSELTSAKHSRGAPCIVETVDELMGSVIDIMEAHVNDRWTTGQLDNWIVRELLPVTPRFYAFGGLPIVPEWRFMIRGGECTDAFPYWPMAAVLETARAAGGARLSEPDVRNLIDKMNGEPFKDGFGEIAEIRQWSIKVCAELEGDFSVDWMKADRGWTLIDMADADSSWTPAMEEAA